MTCAAPQSFQAADRREPPHRERRPVLDQVLTPPEPGDAVVVGATSEIGAAIVDVLRTRHDRVMAWGRDPQRLEALARLENVQSIHVDVRDRASLAEAVERSTSHRPLTVAVWAAGLFDWARADEADMDRWDDVFDVNLAAVARGTRLLLPSLIAAAPSTLILLGSGASRTVFAGNAAYVASKHGVAGLAGAVFADVRHLGVRVSLLSPGIVAAGASRSLPSVASAPSQVLQPRDVAEAVRFIVDLPPRCCVTELQISPTTLPAGEG